MSTPSPRPGPRRPGVPTWALTLLVLAALGGSAWLFWGELTGNDANEPTVPTESDAVDESDDVLSLPDGEAPTDERRRGEEGRTRLDAQDDDSGSEDGPDGASDLPDDLPPAYASLRERRIAITPASATGSGTAARLVRVAPLRVPCATPGPDTALTVEVALAALAADRLTSARADVTGSREDRFGAATCVDARVAASRDADVALVLRVVPEGTRPRVLAGRPTGAAEPGSITLAAELAAALDLDAVTPASSAQTRTMLANAGAIDAPGGASVVLVELPASALVEDGALEAIAEDLVDAIAAHLGRADQRDS